MNYREKYAGNKEDFYFFLKDEVIKLFREQLKIEGNRVVIPNNEELDYQIKLDSDENYGDLSIKVKWGQKPEEEITLDENSKSGEDQPFDFEF